MKEKERGGKEMIRKRERWDRDIGKRKGERERHLYIPALILI